MKNIELSLGEKYYLLFLKQKPNTTFEDKLLLKLVHNDKFNQALVLDFYAKYIRTTNLSENYCSHFNIKSQKSIKL